MPYHVSDNGLDVLDEQGHIVPGGHHDTHAEALAHEQAMNIATRREEGRPVAPKLGKALSTEERDQIPDSDFVDPERRRFYIRTAADVGDAVHSFGRAQPPIPYDRFKERLTAIARRKGFESSLPDEWKEEKASWIPDPTDEDYWVWAVENGGDVSDLFKDDPHEETSPGSPPYVTAQGDLLADRASYHHSPERFNYVPAPDWNSRPDINDNTMARYLSKANWANAQTELPDIWLLAHPFGDEGHKDAHGEYFDKATNFYDDIFPNGIPVSYYHNYSPDGTPLGEPVAIGRTLGYQYFNQPHIHGKGFKIHFDNEKLNSEPEIKARLGKAMAERTLRGSPTVVPDFHRVNDQTGHIDNWLTGSIAVLDASGARQPANALAIGIPQMKALFKSANIPFPRGLQGGKMGSTLKAAPWKGRLAKALSKSIFKALGEFDENEGGTHKHADGSEHADHEGSDQPHGHEFDAATKTLKTVFKAATVERTNPSISYGGDWQPEQFKNPGFTESGRFDGAPSANVEKDVQPLANIGEELERQAEALERQGPEGDQDIRLNMEPDREKAMMKAQIQALRQESDLAHYEQWFGAQLVAGKVVPSEHDLIRFNWMNALEGDRRYHPVMKMADGKQASALIAFQQSVELRPGRFNGNVTADQMKALGWTDGAGFGSTTAAKKPLHTPEELIAMTEQGKAALRFNKKNP